ncbi:DUF4238 domain-containing protein [Polaromonas sp. CT11-55]|uniref:DUF4238 domain-containing protein n=1 Tax=Polaromonas sp. CT11-55 TaxID=3243045 RepID=UPI0039A72BA7
MTLVAMSAMARLIGPIRCADYGELLTGDKITQVKIQHYVPQFLLRNFTSDKKNRVHVFDKQKGITFVSHVKNVANESRFYDFEIEGEGRSLEAPLSSLESDNSGHSTKLIL